MRDIRWVDEVVKAGSWTCRRCLRVRGRPKRHADWATYTTKPGSSPPRTIATQRASQLKRSLFESAILKAIALKSPQIRSHSPNGPALKESTVNKSPVSKGIRRAVILAIIAVGSIWIFSDDARHRYGAVKRAFRVFHALVWCLRECVLPFLYLHVWRSRWHS